MVHRHFVRVRLHLLWFGVLAYISICGADRKAQDESLILVDGLPRRIIEHARLASSNERGEYLSTITVLIRGDRVAIPIFSKDVADILAASLFRQHSLPFDVQYIGGTCPASVALF
jgi:hypothetical protein